MAFSATVLPVMLASPGDVNTYREIARATLHEWNYVQSTESRVVLMPVGWETHSSPELGARPQELINQRVLEECDLLVGIFWTRLGTPTGEAKSGTVEEIHRHVEAGKPAMIYFCQAPAALQTVDPEQYAALQQFRKWCEGQGLVQTFLNEAEFSSLLRRQLQITLQKNSYLRELLEEASKSSLSQTGKATSLNNDDEDKSPSNLTIEAQKILLAAASTSDAHGTIMYLESFEGRYLQVGSDNLGDGKDPRSIARWDYGLEQLESLGYIERIDSGRSQSSRVYKVTHAGYELSNYIPHAQ